MQTVTKAVTQAAIEAAKAAVKAITEVSTYFEKCQNIHGSVQIHKYKAKYDITLLIKRYREIE